MARYVHEGMLSGQDQPRGKKGIRYGLILSMTFSAVVVVSAAAVALAVVLAFVRHFRAIGVVSFDHQNSIQNPRKPRQSNEPKHLSFPSLRCRYN